MTNRKRIWGWYFFDWASQPYHTLLVTFIYGPFFATVAASYFLSMGMDDAASKANAQVYWSWCLTITGLLIGIGAPIMGAIADTAGKRRPWIYFFSLLYVVGSFGLWWTNPDGSNMWLMLVMFGIGFIGAEYALIFTNAQLPSIGTKEEVGKISGSGFAFGYAGGLIALVIALILLVEQPNGKTLVGLDPLFGLDASQKEGTRFIGPFTALWFAVFMVPYFAWVKEPNRTASKINISASLTSLKSSIIKLKHRKSLSGFLLSSMFYRDALNGLYGFGGVYASLVLDWTIVQVGTFGIIAALSAAIFSWVGGIFDKRLGPKPVIIFTVWTLVGVCFVIINMSRDALLWIELAQGSKVPDITFMICGVIIGGMGGALQSASRSLMVRHSDQGRSTESFGLYGLSGRATAFMAPGLIGLVTTWTQSARIGVSPLIGLFLIGLLLLAFVNPKGDADEWDVR